MVWKTINQESQAPLPIRSGGVQDQSAQSDGKDASPARYPTELDDAGPGATISSNQPAMSNNPPASSPKQFPRIRAVVINIALQVKAFQRGREGQAPGENDRHSTTGSGEKD